MSCGRVGRQQGRGGGGLRGWNRQHECSSRHSIAGRDCAAAWSANLTAKPVNNASLRRAELLRLEQILEKVQFLDNLVNGAETQAAYENVLKVMDNQVVSDSTLLWEGLRAPNCPSHSDMQLTPSAPTLHHRFRTCPPTFCTSRPLCSGCGTRWRMTSWPLRPSSTSAPLRSLLPSRS